MQAMADQHNRTYRPLMVIFIIWIAYTALYQVLKSYVSIAGTLEFLMVNGLNAVLAIYFWNVWVGVPKHSLSRKILFLFALSYSVVLVESSIYHAIYNVLHISKEQISFSLRSFYNALYVIYLFFQFLAWVAIFAALKDDSKKSSTFYIPSFFVLLVMMIVSFYTIIWTSGQSSFGIYDFSEKLLETMHLIMVILCLILCRNKGLFYFAIGILISALSSFVMTFELFAQGYGVHGFLETGWVLGRLFMLFGLIRLSNTGIEDARSWLITANSSVTKKISNSFVFGISLLSVLFMIAYFINPSLF
jgi:hypothetical protein